MAAKLRIALAVACRYDFCMGRAQRIVILTGAGISAESGVPTFRSSDGLWEGHDVREVATPAGFRANPVLVQRFYDARRAHLATVEPNAAHLALARLEAAQGPGFLLVTQNVDDLHERAGTARLVHMHGELKRARCTACGAAPRWEGPLVDAPPCPACQTRGRLRPDIVWFGEMPYEMARIEAAVATCDLFVSVGTSGAVYPAAGFVEVARSAGARTVELNLDESAVSGAFDESRRGAASQLVPAFVQEILKR
jgi:NAD-dependent deacetylase